MIVDAASSKALEPDSGFLQKLLQNHSLFTPTPRLDCRGRRGDAGGNGAKSLSFYIVSQAANVPQNAINLALLSSGLLKIVVVGGVWSVNTLTGAVTLTTTNVALALRYDFTSIRL